MKATIIEGLTMMADMDYVYPTNIPVPLSAEVGTLAANIIVVTFDQDLNNATLPAITCFVVTGAYLNAQVTAVAIVGDEVRLTLANNVSIGDVITIYYSVPPTNGIRNINNVYASSFTSSVTNNIVYPYPELIVLGRWCIAQQIFFDTQYDTIGDAAAYVDFIIKINGVNATITSLNDGDDSRIRLNITETIIAGDVITLSYNPNPARWIFYPHVIPSYVLYAMNNVPVINLV